MRLEFFPKQDEFAKAALSLKYLYLLYAGSIRSGKTVVGIGLLMLLCRIFPGSRWAIVRKNLPTLKRNTVPSFEAIKPTPFFGPINRTDWFVRCENGSEILFFPESFPEDPDLDRWKGLEVNGFLLEEANELNHKSFLKAVERAGTWKVPGTKQPPVLVLLTCNPGPGYLKDTFYKKHRVGALEAPYYFLRAKMTDNPHNDPAYLASLENLPPDEYARFVLGDWDASDDPRQLIKYEWVLNAMKNVEAVEGKSALGVDVARFGDDQTCLIRRRGNYVHRIERFPQTSIDFTSDLVQAWITDDTDPIDAELVNVDVVGLGAGVVDNLSKEGFEVTEVNSGGRQVEREDSIYSFFNLRSQLWWESRERLRLGEMYIGFEDRHLIEDLTAPRYKISGDKVIRVESKDEIKKRLGRSTDAGDAYVYCDARDLATDRLYMA